MTPELRARIQKAIDDNEVLLFMKGTRTAPSCGFSAKAVEMLDTLLADYATVDVLAHPEVREGIKDFSSWPTIPQLYVRGKFFGGADLIAEMFEAGELAENLGLQKEDAPNPKLSVTESALSAFRGYLGESDEVILLDIDRNFDSGLSVGPAPAQGLVLTISGVRFALDRLSATRADGLTIDFVTTPEGQAFKIDSPNKPPALREMSVTALDARRKAGTVHRLIDVRGEGERRIANIEGSEMLTAELKEELLSLPKDTTLIFQCHHGMRSARAAETFVQQGFREVFNLTGGIDAWSAQVDPTIPRY